MKKSILLQSIQRLGSLLLISSVSGIFALTQSLYANDETSVQSGNWSDDATWSGTAPAAGDDVEIVDGHTVTSQASGNVGDVVDVGENGAAGTLDVTGGDLSVGTINLGRNDPGEDGIINLSGGTLNVSSILRISQAGQTGGLSGQFFQTGGALIANQTYFSRFNNTGNNTALYEISGGTASMGEVEMYGAENENQGNIGQSVNNTFRVSGSNASVSFDSFSFQADDGAGGTTDQIFDFVFDSAGITSIDSTGTLNFDAPADYTNPDHTFDITLGVDLNSLNITSDASYLLFDASGGGSVSGTFLTEDIDFAGNSNITGADVRYEADQVWVDVAAVPEPSAGALLLSAAGLMLAFRRRRG